VADPAGVAAVRPERELHRRGVANAEALDGLKYTASVAIAVELRLALPQTAALLPMIVVVLATGRGGADARPVLRDCARPRTLKPTVRDQVVRGHNIFGRLVGVIRLDAANDRLRGDLASGAGLKQRGARGRLGRGVRGGRRGLFGRDAGGRLRGLHGRHLKSERIEGEILVAQMLSIIEIGGITDLRGRLRGCRGGSTRGVLGSALREGLS
jgi:hypothetical protein